jgi:hypothetical protein
MSVTKLVLDYSKWRSGLRSHNQVGRGSTVLRNKEGYMCCLGQWCSQLGVSDEELEGNSEPWSVKTNADISLFTQPDLASGGLESSRLARDAIFINDEHATTPVDKINKLTNLLGSYGIELEVINIPK